MTTMTRMLFLFGLAVLASGFLRFFGQEGGDKALWFGLVMGGLALLGAVCLRVGRARLGWGLGVLAVVFVGGWFGYESFVRKGLAAAELRQLVILGLAVATAAALWAGRTDLRRSDAS